MLCQTFSLAFFRMFFQSFKTCSFFTSKENGPYYLHHFNMLRTEIRIGKGNHLGHSLPVKIIVRKKKFFLYLSEKKDSYAYPKIVSIFAKHLIANLFDRFLNSPFPFFYVLLKLDKSFTLCV